MNCVLNNDDLNTNDQPDSDAEGRRYLIRPMHMFQSSSTYHQVFQLTTGVTVLFVTDDTFPGEGTCRCRWCGALRLSRGTFVVLCTMMSH